jgi:1-deoxy-D-xylulose-5-phosphate synthase
MEKIEKLLDKIENPQDLKKLAAEKLPLLAEEIRHEIVRVVSQTGGHLASSLGAVELAIAVHYVFNAPRDKIVWDVGHQAYAHKLLTGRRKNFVTLRQHGGISGFPHREESEYDCFTTGHGSTSISTALGLITARQLKGTQEKVVAIIGDASLGGGMAFEAMNHAGNLNQDLVVILNDNEMSISKSVGALSRYLNRIISTPIYNRIRKDVEGLVKRVPRFGFRVYRAARKLEEGLKNLLTPGIIFEELGFRYFGPIDGHNLTLLVSTLNNVKDIGEPVFVHVLTKKGKGYPLAENLPEKFHGVGSFEVKTGRKKSEEEFTFTQAFSQKLLALAAKTEKVCAITAAMPEGTGLDHFQEEFSERFFDVGMAEGHAVGFAAGLASSGMVPVVAIYSTFLQRAYDQIIHDVCLQNLHVVFAVDRAGIVGEDGPTHQGIFDLAFLSHIPNLTLMAPKDGEELGEMLDFAVNQLKGPVAIRYPRAHCPNFKSKSLFLELGKAEILREGKDLAIFTLGALTFQAARACDDLSRLGIEATLVNARFANPLDKALILELARKIKLFVTVEDAILDAGFGAKVLEFLETANVPNLRLVRLGLPQKFIEHGQREFLLEKYGLSAHAIAKKIKEELAQLKGQKVNA